MPSRRSAHDGASSTPSGYEGDPAQYHDSYTDQLRRLIDLRAKGKQIEVEEAPAARANVTDLMQALQASVEAANKARAGDVATPIEKAADGLAESAEDEGGRTRKSRPRASKKRPARKSA